MVGGLIVGAGGLDKPKLEVWEAWEFWEEIELKAELEEETETWDWLEELELLVFDPKELPPLTAEAIKKKITITAKTTTRGLVLYLSFLDLFGLAIIKKQGQIYNFF